MKVVGAAECMEGWKKSLKLMIQRDFTQHFCMDWTLMVELRCRRLRGRLPPWCYLLSLQSPHTPFKVCPRMLWEYLGSLSPAAWHSSWRQRAAAPKIMMHMQWQTPLLCYFLNVKCTDITIRAQSAQERILRKWMKDNMLMLMQS